MDVCWTFRLAKDSLASKCFVAGIFCLTALSVTHSLFADEAQLDAAQASAAKGVTTQKTTQTKVVALTIDYGDGFQKRLPKVTWRAGMTVLDVLEEAKKHPRARLKIRYQGSGATALLLQIDDVVNQGGGKLNWIYSINGKKADRSFAIKALQPSDEVLWKFETYL